MLPTFDKSHSRNVDLADPTSSREGGTTFSIIVSGGIEVAR